MTKISRRKKEASTHGRNFGGTNKICWTLLIWFNDSVVTLQVAVMENRTTVRRWEVNWEQNNILPCNAGEVRVICLWCIKMHHSFVKIKSILKPFHSCFLTFKLLAEFCILQGNPRSTRKKGLPSLFLSMNLQMHRVWVEIQLWQISTTGSGCCKLYYLMVMKKACHHISCQEGLS